MKEDAYCDRIRIIYDDGGGDIGKATRATWDNNYRRNRIDDVTDTRGRESREVKLAYGAEMCTTKERKRVLPPTTS